MDICDAYSHISPALFYITQRIEGTGGSEVNEVFEVGCSCVDLKCVYPKCECLRFKDNFVLTNNILLLNYAPDDKASPIMECHEKCQCFNPNPYLQPIKKHTESKSFHNFCLNTSLQRGPLPFLKIFDTKSKGYGLLTLSRISRGQFICEYAGEVVSAEEGERRRQENKRLGKMNYVFTLYEHFGEKQTITCVDPGIFGNIGRYMNHSCDPNASIVPIRISGPVPHLAVFAIKNIECDEEITFNYAAGLENNIVGGKLCLCGTDKCLGYLPAS